MNQEETQVFSNIIIGKYDDCLDNLLEAIKSRKRELQRKSFRIFNQSDQSPDLQSLGSTAKLGGEE